ncbi:MAG: hypothetical protein KIT80_05790 [Chitinophagaceae bacterium]|nr:hypothetical protein [Chitinophagaceae bacterium]MCW5926404.1 hypothetical protein [Chitinophagaceae bacterium]
MAKESIRKVKLHGKYRPFYACGRCCHRTAWFNVPTGFAYDYFLKDHLGNIRMVLTAAGAGLRRWRCVLADLLPKHYLFRYNNSHAIYAMPV